MNPNPKDLAERIKQLEGALPDLRGRVAEAEKAVASAFAAGKLNPTQELDALAREKNALAGSIRALSDLDAMHYTAAFDEYNTACEAEREKARKRYLDVSGALAKAVKETLAPILAAASVPGGLLDTFADRVKTEAWATLEAMAADAIRAIGPAPSEPLPRDESGVPKPAGGVR